MSDSRGGQHISHKIRRLNKVVDRLTSHVSRSTSSDSSSPKAFQQPMDTEDSNNNASKSNTQLNQGNGCFDCSPYECQEAPLDLSLATMRQSVALPVRQEQVLPNPLDFLAIDYNNYYNYYQSMQYPFSSSGSPPSVGTVNNKSTPRRSTSSDDMFMDIEMRNSVLNEAADAVDFLNSVDIDSKSKTPDLLKGLCDDEGSPYSCAVCGETFLRRDRLTKHIASRHRDQTMVAAKERDHICTICFRGFTRSDMLTRHARLHTGDKPYSCSVCNQVFSRSDHLSTHRRTHTGEKPYRCPQCPYEACRRDMVTRHMKTHGGKNSQAGGAGKSSEDLRQR